MGEATALADADRRARAGVLDPGAARHHLDLVHLEPPAALAAWVDHLWCVTWRAPQGHVQEVIPRPAVQLVAERADGPGTRARLQVHGVVRRRFSRELRGEDRAVAVSFAPAGFRPFLGASVAATTGAQLPWSNVVGTSRDDDRRLAEALLDPALPPADAAAVLADHVLQHRPTPHPLTAELRALVAAAEHDTSLTRAEQLAALAGVTLRTLQRRFAEHVGVGPKWVVQRCRLLDVAAAAHADRPGDEPVDWAALAVDLGYADQSHLIRAFTALVGRPPGAYARHGRAGAR